MHISPSFIFFSFSYLLFLLALLPSPLQTTLRCQPAKIIPMITTLSQKSTRPATKTAAQSLHPSHCFYLPRNPTHPELFLFSGFFAAVLYYSIHRVQIQTPFQFCLLRSLNQSEAHAFSRAALARDTDHLHENRISVKLACSLKFVCRDVRPATFELKQHSAANCSCAVSRALKEH